MEIEIIVANDFSKTPQSREEGDEFREDYLMPKFLIAREIGHKLNVILDGAEGYATSFLEAAFGGLAKEYSPAEVLQTVVFQCEDEPSLIDEISRYIRDADKAKWLQK